MQGSYTGMAAANFSPDAICTVSAATVGGPWLAELIVFNTLLILFAVTAIAIFDARLADRNALAARALHSVNQELLERTQRAEQAERELRESEERFRSLTDLSSDWYWEQDETLRFTRMSGGVLEETGMDPGSFIGKHRWDFPIIVDQEALAAHKAQLVAHEPFREFVYARRNKDGDLEYISASGMPLFDGDGRFLGYRGIGRNVTEQKRSEADILRAREQLRLALVGSKLALFEWNVPTGEVFLNERWAEMTRATSGSTSTTIEALEDLVHPDDAQEVRSRISSALDGRSAFYEAEHRVRTTSGDYVWIQSLGKVVERDATGRATRISGTNADISERKRAEQALRNALSDLDRGVRTLERRNREITQLAELSNFLLSCVTVDEACNAIPRYAEALFPEDRGALYLLRASRDRLVAHACWGGGGSESHPPFAPGDCWALRRGHVHAVSDPERDSICTHVSALGSGMTLPHVCVPMLVQGELIGMLWTTLSRDAESGEADRATRRLAVSLSEQIALALSNIRLRDHLHQQTIRDPLTGLYNRRFLDEALAREVARCKRSGSRFSVLMLDVDHFKRFNDTYGHDAGDAVLRDVARTLRENTRQSDIVCRQGGEEFVVLLPDAGLEGAATRAARIGEVVRSMEIAHAGRSLAPVTVSIGVATYPDHGADANQVLRSADKALYAAKGTGRDRLMVAA